MDRSTLELISLKYRKIMNIRYSNGKERNENFMNIQIFGTKKCSDTRKAERFFKERGIKISIC